MSKSTAVGAFVLGAAVLATAAIVLFGGQHLFAKRLRVVAFFQNSVAGLAVGAPVTLRGVKIGTVSSMKIYMKLPEVLPVIPVYMEIDPGQVSWTAGGAGPGPESIDAAIKAGLRAQLATQSLVTGQVSINLDFHPENVPTLTGDADVPEIPTMPSDIQRIKDEIADLKLSELTDQARIALTGINDIVGELRGKVAPIADSVRDTSEATRATMETAAAAVRQLQLDASRTLDSVSHLATATQNQILTTGKDLGRVAATADRAAARAEKVMDNLNDITGSRSPLRGDLEAALRDLAASASSLRTFTRDVERNPTGTLLGRASK
jgi:paraquat-inducible protein B